MIKYLFRKPPTLDERYAKEVDIFIKNLRKLYRKAGMKI